MKYSTSAHAENEDKSNTNTTDTDDGASNKIWTTKREQQSQQQESHSLQPSNSLWWSHLMQTQNNPQFQYQKHFDKNLNFPPAHDPSSVYPGYLYSSQRWHQQILAHQAFTFPPPVHVQTPPPPPLPPTLSSSDRAGTKQTMIHSVDLTIPPPPPPPPLPPSHLHPMHPTPPYPSAMHVTKTQHNFSTSANRNIDSPLQENQLQNIACSLRHEGTVAHNNVIFPRKNPYIKTNKNSMATSQKNEEDEIDDTEDVESINESVEMDMSLDSDSLELDESQNQIYLSQNEEHPSKRTKSNYNQSIISSSTHSPMNRIELVAPVNNIHEITITRTEILKSSLPSSSSAHQYAKILSSKNSLSEPLLRDNQMHKNKTMIEPPKTSSYVLIDTVTDSHSEKNKEAKRNLESDVMKETYNKSVPSILIKQPNGHDNISNELAKKRALVLQTIKLAALKRKNEAEMRRKALLSELNLAQNSVPKKGQVGNRQDFKSNDIKSSPLPDITALSQRLIIRKISQSGPVDKVRIQDENFSKDKVEETIRDGSVSIKLNKSNSISQTPQILVDIEENKRQNDVHRMKLARLKVLLAAKVRQRKQNSQNETSNVLAKRQISSKGDKDNNEELKVEFEEETKKNLTKTIEHNGETKAAATLSSPTSSPSKVKARKLNKTSLNLQSSAMHNKLMKQKRELQNTIDVNKMKNIRTQQQDLLNNQQARFVANAELLEKCSKEIQLEEKIISMKKESLKTLKKRKIIMESMLNKMNLKLMDTRKRLRGAKHKQESENQRNSQNTQTKANSSHRGRASDFF